MNPSKTPPKTTELCTALSARERWNYVVEIGDMLHHDGTPVGKVAFVINTKADDLGALAAAHEESARRAKPLPTGAASFVADPAVTDDLKNVEALWRCMRVPGKLAEHAFITPLWMLEHLDTDQLGTLLRFYNECRKRRGPLPWDITPEWIDAIREAVVASQAELIPERPLVAFSHGYLTDFLAQALCLWKSRETMLLRRIEELERGREGASEEPSAEDGDRGEGEAGEPPEEDAPDR
jgi:hypothetical protein